MKVYKIPKHKKSELAALLRTIFYPALEDRMRAAISSHPDGSLIIYCETDDRFSEAVSQVSTTWSYVRAEVAA